MAGKITGLRGAMVEKAAEILSSPFGKLAVVRPASKTAEFGAGRPRMAGRARCEAGYFLRQSHDRGHGHRGHPECERARFKYELMRIFQNTAEERAGGGNQEGFDRRVFPRAATASCLVLTDDGGRDGPRPGDAGPSAADFTSKVERHGAWG